jgi:ABC-type transport system involved in multi-copper enzyme maturation permease subunit
MIAELIQKEIKVNLLTARFAAGLIFSVVVFAGGAMVFCLEYKSQLEDYQYHRSAEDAVLSASSQVLQRLYTTRFRLVKEPRLSQFFASGSETRYPRTLAITPSVMGRGGLFSASDLNAQKQNYMLERPQDFDLVFVVGIVLSFLVIVLSFDAISGDREQGTLRQQLSTSTSRAQILMAKYSAILVLLLIPVISGSICSIAIVHAFLGKNLLVLFPTQSLLNGILGFLYLSLFIWLALWLSAAFPKPSTALAVLLLFWTFVTTLSPFLGSMLASRVYPIESEENFQRRFQVAIQEATLKLPQQAVEVSMGKRNEDDVDWTAAEEGFAQAEQVMANYFMDHLNQLLGQADFAESVNFFSPLGTYRQASECLSNTGLRYHKKFIDAAMRYRGTFKDFIREQDSRDPESRHRMIWHPMFTSLSKRPVDPRLIPVFTSPPPAVSVDDVRGALPSIAYLFVLNFAFFFLALGTFVRADVR